MPSSPDRVTATQAQMQLVNEITLPRPELATKLSAAEKKLETISRGIRDAILEIFTASISIADEELADYSLVLYPDPQEPQPLFHGARIRRGGKPPEWDVGGIRSVKWNKGHRLVLGFAPALEVHKFIIWLSIHHTDDGYEVNFGDNNTITLSWQGKLCQAQSEMEKLRKLIRQGIENLAEIISSLHQIRTRAYERIDPLAIPLLNEPEDDVVVGRARHPLGFRLTLTETDAETDDHD